MRKGRNDKSRVNSKHMDDGQATSLPCDPSCVKLEPGEDVVVSPAENLHLLDQLTRPTKVKYVKSGGNEEMLAPSDIKEEPQDEEWEPASEDRDQGADDDGELYGEDDGDEDYDPTDACESVKQEAGDAAAADSDEAGAMLDPCSVEPSDGAGRLLNCKLCSFQCRNQCRMRTHLKFTHEISKGNRRLQCEWCHYSTSHLNYMRKHRHMHTSGTAYQCDVCESKFAAQWQLSTHLHVAHKMGLPFTCKECGREFVRSFNLRRHMGRVNGSMKVLSCDVCKETFGCKSLLNNHICPCRNENELHHCDVCESVFVSKTNLTKHIKAAHKDKCQHTCTDCGKMFTKRTTLLAHVRTVHAEFRLHKCEPCGKVFKHACSLRIHQARHEEYEEEFVL